MIESYYKDYCNSLKDYYLHKNIIPNHWQEEFLNSIRKDIELKNYLIITPTGTGKTFAADYFIMRNLYPELITKNFQNQNQQQILNNIEKKSSIVCVPLRELANQFQQDLSLKFPTATLKTFLKLEANKPKLKDIFICTYERALGLIYSLKAAGRLKKIGCLIIDEVHLFNDENRGKNIEELMIICNLMKIPILSLTGTMNPNHEFIKKYNFKIIFNEQPRNLIIRTWLNFKANRQTNLNDNLGLYINNNNNNNKNINNNNNINNLKINENFKEGLKMNLNNTIPINHYSKALNLITKKTLIFVPTKKGLKELVEEFKKLNVLSFGVHNADEKEEENKKVIEKWKNDEIDIIFATSTLAAGVDLPNVKKVILWGIRYNSDTAYDNATLIQMTGRTGRGLNKGEVDIIIERWDNFILNNYLKRKDLYLKDHPNLINLFNSRFKNDLNKEDFKIMELKNEIEDLLYDLNPINLPNINTHFKGDQSLLSRLHILLNIPIEDLPYAPEQPYFQEGYITYQGNLLGATRCEKEDIPFIINIQQQLIKNVFHPQYLTFYSFYYGSYKSIKMLTGWPQDIKTAENIFKKIQQKYPLLIQDLPHEEYWNKNTLCKKLLISFLCYQHYVYNDDKLFPNLTSFLKELIDLKDEKVYQLLDEEQTALKGLSILMNDNRFNNLASDLIKIDNGINLYLKEGIPLYWAKILKKKKIAIPFNPDEIDLTKFTIKTPKSRTPRKLFYEEMIELKKIFKLKY